MIKINTLYKRLVNQLGLKLLAHVGAYWTQKSINDYVRDAYHVEAALLRIAANHQSATIQSNQQLDELYEDVYLTLPPDLQAKWVARLGLPQYAAYKQEGEPYKNRNPAFYNLP